MRGGRKGEFGGRGCTHNFILEDEELAKMQKLPDKQAGGVGLLIGPAV